MEGAIKTLVTTFVKSSNSKGNLDSKSFKKLVQKQFSGMMEDTNSSQKVKEMQDGLDANNDGQVSFDEFLTLIGYLANSVSDRMTANSQAASDGS